MHQAQQALFVLLFIYVLLYQLVKYDYRTFKKNKTTKQMCLLCFLAVLYKVLLYK